ncbi:MAG TPA: DUF1573 domain-containing protein [Pirellulales bacterium]
MTDSSIDRGVGNASHAWDVARIVLGLFLIVAAGLKTEQLWRSPYDGFGTLDHPLLLSAAVEAELLVGIWALAGVWPRACWNAAVLLFTLFAFVSVARHLRGAASCNCFGRADISPLAALFIDGVVISGLCFARPTLADAPNAPRGRAGRASAASMYAFLTALTVAAAIATLPPISMARRIFPDAPLLGAWSAGEPIAIAPRFIDFGELDFHEVRLATIELKNVSAHKVTVLGWRKSCTCVAATGFPHTLLPGEAHKITLTFEAATMRPKYSESVSIYTDKGGTGNLSIELACRRGGVRTRTETAH